MTALPAKTSISDTYPNPSKATARAGFAQRWDACNEVIEKPELDIASGTTCDIGGQLSTKLRITGTTTITSFGTNYRGPILLRMAGALTITHNSTTLVCPGGANITAAAGDAFIAWPKATSGAADGWQVAKVSFAAATTSSQGVVELATDSEAQAGTDATRCVTPDNLGAVVPGLGQSWQDVTISRAVSTAYTNSTGRSIFVSVYGGLSAVGSILEISVSGVTRAKSGAAYANGAFVSVSGVMIPPGATYSIVPNSGTFTLSNWYEMR